MGRWTKNVLQTNYTTHCHWAVDDTQYTSGLRFPNYNNIWQWASFPPTGTWDLKFNFIIKSLSAQKKSRGQNYMGWNVSVSETLL